MNKSFSIALVAAALAIVLTFMVSGFLDLSFGHSLEAWMGDNMLTWRYDLLKKTEPGRKPDSQLLLVPIDQQSVNDLGRWPFPRATDAQFLQVLAPENPKVIAWDVFFTETTAPSSTPSGVPADSASTNSPAAASPKPVTPPANTSVPSSPVPSPSTNPGLQPDDSALVEGARLFSHMVSVAAGDPIGGSSLKNDDGLTRPLKNIVGDANSLLAYPFAVIPFAELRKVSYFGFAEANAGDLRRTLPLVVNIGGKVFPSFDLQIILQYWDVDPDHVVVDIGREITLTKPDGTQVLIPIDENGGFLVNYRARSQDFLGMNYSEMGKALADKANHKVSDKRSPLPSVKDKIVMVGVTLSGTDNGPIPIEAYSPLVIAHLNVLNNILQHDYLRRLSAGIWMPLYGLFLFGLANTMLRVGIAPMIPVGLLALLLLGDAAFAVLWFGNEMTPVLAPELGILLLAAAVPTRRFFGEEREKTRIKNVLRANLSDKVMNKMLEDPNNVKLGGSKQEITIMFCDIRNFTKYCDNRDPQEVMNALNEYMEEMTQVVFKHEGTIDKYIGDCIMAFWNAPQPQPDHARQAVACAIEMRALRTRFEMRGIVPEHEFFDCGIGIHTGEALVGNMGSSLKRNYTAMGSTVNLAARLESLTKQLNERILISKEVVDRLGGDFPLKDRGEMYVTGFVKPVHVFAVVTKKNRPQDPSDVKPILTEQPLTAGENRPPFWKMAPASEDEEKTVT
jgi:adenylate cyclase